MAVILEIVHPGGACTRHRLAQLPLTLGRSLASDLVLDDPYVDGTHARLALDEYGGLHVEDLGSVNGLVADDRRLRGRISVQPGAEVRVGRTVLRFRDQNEAVAPALVDDAVARTASDAMSQRGDVQPREARPVLRAGMHWPETRASRLLVIALTSVAFSLYTWLGNASRSGASDVVSTMLAFALLASLWAGVWAVASRITVQRFHFMGHLAIASTVALGMLGLTTASDWFSFFFPDNAALSALSVLLSLALLAVLVAGHLSLASNMRPRRQWRVGLIVSGAVLAIGGLAALADDDSFSDVPTFSSTLKPVAASWVPAKPVSDFDHVAAKLKKEVDQLAKK